MRPLEFTGDLAYSVDGTQVASGKGLVILVNEEEADNDNDDFIRQNLGVPWQPRVAWRINGGIFRKEQSGKFRAGHIRGVSQTAGQQTVVVQYSEMIPRYRPGTLPGMEGPSSFDEVRHQVAIRTPQFNTLHKALESAVEVALAQRAAAKAEQEAEAKEYDEDTVGRPLPDDVIELIAGHNAIRSIHEVDVQEYDIADDGTSYACDRYTDFNLFPPCRAAWQHYEVIFEDETVDERTLCARCVRDLTGTSGQ